MKRAFLSLLMVAFLIWGVSGCAPRPATYVPPTVEAPRTDIAVQAGQTATPADPPMNDVAAAVEGELTPAEALKLMLLHLLVAR